MGAPRKDPDKRRRRNIDPIESAGLGVTLPPEEQPQRPDMPLHPKHPARAWHPLTMDFWDVVADSPQARLWGATDWRHLAETLIVYDRWVTAESGTEYVALERAVRARTGLMGYTYGDRLRLRMKAQIVPTSADGQEREPTGRPAGGTGGYGLGRFAVFDGGQAHGSPDAG